MRIAFLFGGGAGWLGGVNYLWNLLHALSTHAAEELTPVLFCAPGTDLHGLDRLPGVELAGLPPAPADRIARLRSIAQRRLGGSDEALAALFQRHRIDLVSHSSTFGWRFPVATLPWIPDLQHRRMPEYFSFSERRIRDYGMMHELAEGRATLVSSEAARADCRRYYGPLARHVEVLRFVSQPRIAVTELATLEGLRERHGLPPRFFFLPNQFWRHKNHRVVVDALATLADRADPPAVVLTGRGEDYRAPDYFPRLMEEVREKGLTRLFVHLGTVPFSDLVALMRHSIAVINPSKFEGWSTTVEESRSLGKRILLSDIDVHREQAPPGARYFDPDDARGLANLLEETWRAVPPGPDLEMERAAAQLLPARTEAFARTYLEIARRAVST